MHHIKTLSIFFFLMLIGKTLYGQKNYKKDLIATWQLIETKSDSLNSKVNVGELIVYNKEGDTLKTTKENSNIKIDKSYLNRYMKINKKYVTYYFYGNGSKKLYKLKNDSLKIDEYDEFKIIELTKDYLILKGKIEFYYKKVNIDLSDYIIFKD
ncbi:hypothetical protein [Olleya sp. R77988]|uniref:hypothetical protein n=1 Tax=Olleya sp. R77988 TaxID=3093875 RepID=UPI0037C7BDD4